MIIYYLVSDKFGVIGNSITKSYLLDYKTLLGNIETKIYSHNGLHNLYTMDYCLKKIHSCIKEAIPINKFAIEMLFDYLINDESLDARTKVGYHKSKLIVQFQHFDYISDEKDYMSDIKIKVRDNSALLIKKASFLIPELKFDMTKHGLLIVSVEDYFYKKMLDNIKIINKNINAISTIPTQKERIEKLIMAKIIAAQEDLLPNILTENIDLVYDNPKLIFEATKIAKRLS